MNIQISKGYVSQKLVAFEQGATFTLEEWGTEYQPIINELRVYDINTETCSFRISATCDKYAVDFASSKYVPPFTVEERIITHRPVAEVEFVS